MYITGMRDPLSIINPLKTGYLIPSCYKEDKVSKWLRVKHAKLTDKFYTKRIIRNRFIKYTITFIASIVVVVGLLALVGYLYYKGVNINGNMTGITIGLAGIAIWLWMEMWLDEVFPTSSWSIDINKRKK